MRYAIVIEQGENNYSAYVPDLPGCVSVGDTLDEVKSEIREAIAFHLDGMREDGLPIPEPRSYADNVEVAVPEQDEGAKAKRPSDEIEIAYRHCRAWRQTVDAPAKADVLAPNRERQIFRLSA